MFQIGDKIVYPMHGAGVIEDIEEREILGKKQKYYVLRIPVGDLKIMIPISNAVEIGIREVIDDHEADNVLVMLKDKVVQESLTCNWNKRYRDNMEKIKTGNVYEIADVVKALYLRDKGKGLSTGERKMLSSAKQILLSELVLAKNMKYTELEDMITKNIELA